MAVPDDEATAAARRVLIGTGVALVVFAVGLGVMVFRPADDPVAPRGAAGSGVLQLDRIGPDPDLPVASYASEAAERLYGTEGRRLAIVSFTDYLTEAQAGEVLEDAVEVDALLVALVGGAPAVVNGGLDTWEAQARRDAAVERAEIASILPTVDDVDFAAFYAAELRRLDALAVATTEAVVFGAVVRSEVATLRALASDDSVRLIDLAPGTSLRPDTEVRGIRPEETTLVGQPPTRPTP